MFNCTALYWSKLCGCHEFVGWRKEKKNLKFIVFEVDYFKMIARRRLADDDDESWSDESID